MKSKKEIIEIAEDHLELGELAVNNCKYVRGCANAGFAVEIYLKAAITKAKGKDDLFTEKSLRTKENKQYQTHNLVDLLKFAELEDELNSERKIDFRLDTAWKYIASDLESSWKSTDRYLPSAHMNEEEARIFLERIKVVTEWIKKRL